MSEFKRYITSYKTLVILFITVVSLWFIMGFIIPLGFSRGLSESGLFGDGFGSVNALFSGLGFVALIYTIMLQINASEDQKKQSRFEFLYSTFEALKADFDNVTVGQLQGIEAIETMINRHERIRVELHIQRYYYLNLCCFELISFMMLITKNSKYLDDDELRLIKTKVAVLYFKYILPFIRTKLIGDEKSQSTLRTFRIRCSEIQKQMKQSYKDVFDGQPQVTDEIDGTIAGEKFQ